METNQKIYTVTMWDVKVSDYKGKQHWTRKKKKSEETEMVSTSELCIGDTILFGDEFVKIVSAGSDRKVVIYTPKKISWLGSKTQTEACMMRERYHNKYVREGLKPKEGNVLVVATVGVGLEGNVMTIYKPPLEVPINGEEFASFGTYISVDAIYR